MDDPAAVLQIPEEEDVQVILDIIEAGYETVEDKYESQDPEGMPEFVARKGSLCQELFGQLSNQGYSRYD